jgi:nucleosome binding factor SPN SPT16 subunit
MKTITDDLSGFFAQGGWTFLESDSGETPEEGIADDSDVEEDDYNPEEEVDSAEEGSESEYSGEEEEDDDFKDEESDSGIKNFLL